MGNTKYEMPRCLGAVGIGAGQEDAEVRVVGVAGPELGTVHEPGVPVPLRRRAQVGQVAARLGLGEELAPELASGQEGRQPPLLLGRRAGGQDGGAGPADADRVVGPGHAGLRQFLIDEELVHRVGPQAPGTRPVGHDVTRGLKVVGARVRVVRQPAPDREPARVVGARQLEVHVSA